MGLMRIQGGGEPSIHHVDVNRRSEHQVPPRQFQCDFPDVLFRVGQGDGELFGLRLGLGDGHGHLELHVRFLNVESVKVSSADFSGINESQAPIRSIRRAVQAKIVLADGNLPARNSQRQAGIEDRPEIAAHPPDFPYGQGVELRRVVVDTLPHRAAVIDGELAGSRVLVGVPVEDAGRSPVIRLAAFGDDRGLGLLTSRTRKYPAS